MKEMLLICILSFLALTGFPQETYNYQYYGKLTKKQNSVLFMGGLTLQAVGVAGIVGTVYLFRDYPEGDDENSIPGSIIGICAGIAGVGTLMMIESVHYSIKAHKAMREIRQNHKIQHDAWGIKISSDGIGLVYRF